ncbi:MAG: bifunctional phosphopantothenoylcysteine decarboxylase/phosphopantothenate--cysteine ligase CoaBC [Pseudomonadota bacterium]
MELTLEGRRIVLGIGAGIAAYKAPQLVRRLTERGASVRVVLSSSAAQFVTPLSLQAVSGLPVASDLLDPAAEAAMGHIELARWADLILIAPATANLMARLRGGMADDLLTTLVLAGAATVAVAPAMNQQMWAHPATAENARALVGRGVRVLGPAAGQQACGDEGPGRMLEPEQLADCVEHLLYGSEPRLSGLRVVISAGPTFEDLDPVRFLGNRSSGKMGFALAGAAVAHGASVTLVAGPVTLSTPAGVDRIDVRSATQMHDAVHEAVARGCDLYVGAAAVADFRPSEYALNKLKKSGDEGMALALAQNPDILASVAALDGGPFTVGFAAETEALEQHAQSKLERKKVDLLAANRVGRPGCGFDADCNALTVFSQCGQTTLEQQSKVSLAHRLLGLIADAMGGATESNQR